jgi:hypothetical protein
MFTLISTAMPEDAPGSLQRDTYADVLAYIFALNGLPAGPRELPTDLGALREIRMDFVPPPTHFPHREQR